jgi:SAM-dependent methyltransferase
MQTTKLQTWTTTQEEEDRMYDGHLHHWRAIIGLIKEPDLTNKTVLDFGCNQGGFLRTLYKYQPYLRGLGIDIAEESLAIAAQQAGNMPVEYCTVDQFLQTGPSALFDIAFSHEVIYLLQDLQEHARLIHLLLKPGASYYAATGCHTDNSLWSAWHKVISGYSNIPVPNYALSDYIDAFSRSGFDVAYRPMGIHDFVKAEPDDKVYFPTPATKIAYYNNDKMLFRFTRLD